MTNPPVVHHAQGPETQLIVRQHERFSCTLAARLRIAPTDREQVDLARSVGDGSGCVDAAIVDCSAGGLGIQSRIFFPKGAILLVDVLSDSAAPPLFHGQLRVQRAAMIDRTPTYYLGASLPSRDDSSQLALADVIRHVRASFAFAPAPSRSAHSAKGNAPC